MPRKSLKSRLKKVAPRPVKNLRVRARAVKTLMRGGVYGCNICHYQGRLLPYGNFPIRDAYCPRCGSIERHRLAALLIEQHPQLLDGVRMLHFAPEPGLASLFKDRVADYKSADLNPDIADTVLNIESIDLPDASVDLVLCCHVLEHVDDAKALREIHRILTPGGRALLMFPMVDGWEHTYEDPAHKSADDRTRYYGQFDHVRFYGCDARNRITEAGFELSEFTAVEPYVAKYALERGDHIFIATKSPA